MLNEQLFSLYQASLPNLSKMYRDLDNKNITDYVGPLLLHCWEEKYLKSRHQLMIFGQETNGWLDEYIRTQNDIKKAIEHYQNFKLGESYNSLFWQYAHEINLMINGEDNLNFIWNNVNKFGLDGKGRPHPDVLTKEMEQFNIISMETNILKPDVCIFLSGPDYDSDLRRKFPDLQIEPFEDYPIHEAAMLRSSCLPVKSFRTYHPGYGNRYCEWYWNLLKRMNFHIN
jgi:hypothetical protein